MTKLTETSKSVEDIEEIRKKWLENPINEIKTKKDCENILDWFYGIDGFSIADIDTMVKLSRIDSSFRYATELKDSEELKTKAREATLPEITLAEVASVLSSTITHDDVNKQIVLLAGVLNYTDELQLNIGFNSGSSTGKSYIVLEVLKLFPQVDINRYAYVSTQAFYWETGSLTTEDGKPLADRDAYVEEGLNEWTVNNPIPEMGEGRKSWRENRGQEKSRLKTEWNNIEKTITVDLEKRVLVFIDMPSDNLLQRLRPMLSHDLKELEVNITDKDGSGGNKTKHIRIKGYPTVFFLSAGISANEQERNRMFMLSAETSQNKLTASIKMSAKAMGNRQKYKEAINQNAKRTELKERVQMIRDAQISDVQINDADVERIVSRFLNEHPKLSPRNQRDFPRLFALIKAHALLNMFQREKQNDVVIVNDIDIEAGYDLYSEVADANELGISPVLYEFLEKELKRHIPEEGVLQTEVPKWWFSRFSEHLSRTRLEEYLSLLSDVGLIEVQKDTTDKRRNRVFLLGREQDKLLKEV